MTYPLPRGATIGPLTRGGEARLMLSSPRGFHRCPRKGCRVQVPNARYACVQDWIALPEEVRALIRQTARRTVMHPARQEAFRAAQRAWGDL